MLKLNSLWAIAVGREQMKNFLDGFAWHSNSDMIIATKYVDIFGVFSKYSRTELKRTKRHFLNQWSTCAILATDDNLVRIIKSFWASSVSFKGRISNQNFNGNANDKHWIVLKGTEIHQNYCNWLILAFGVVRRSHCANRLQLFRSHCFFLWNFHRKQKTLFTLTMWNS